MIDAVIIDIARAFLPYFLAPLVINVILLILLSRSKGTYRLDLTRPANEKRFRFF